MSESPPAAQTTSLSRSWKLKMLAFFVVAAGIGVWGFLDAAVFYPRSGEAYSSLMLKNYLERAKEAGRLSQAKVADPRRDLQELRARKLELLSKSTSSGPEGRIAAMELAKLEWLESLAVIGRADRAKDRIEASPDAQLAALQTQWNTRSRPKALSRLDIPTQWLITTIGFGIAAAVLVSWVRAGRQKFRWDGAEKRLTLPDGVSFTPADVKEFDKRRWHKFFVTIVLKNGPSAKLDLLRYSPLEEWVLEMERIAFPESAAAENGEPGEHDKRVSPDRGEAADPEGRAAGLV